MGTPERLGLIINPIAGMGGKVALKGTDGAQTLAAAQARGARPEAQEKAARALRPLLPCRERVVILTASGPMGEELSGRSARTPSRSSGPASRLARR